MLPSTETENGFSLVTTPRQIDVLLQPASPWLH